MEGQSGALFFAVGVALFALGMDNPYIRLGAPKPRTSLSFGSLFSILGTIYAIAGFIV